MNQKQAGQYMTPDWVVTLLLDTIGFKGAEVLEKTFLNHLLEMVPFYELAKNAPYFSEGMNWRNI